jgi:hypothetical protein
MTAQEGRPSQVSLGDDQWTLSKWFYDTFTDTALEQPIVVLS